MDPNLPFPKNETKQTTTTDIPSHGTIPKWLEEISHRVVSAEENHKNKISKFFNDLEQNSRSETNSAKFGRRSSLTAQLLGEIPSTNIKLSPTEYLVPAIDEPIDFKSLHRDQTDLEKSWKSLDNFKLSHKGRLDSAKNAIERSNFDAYFLSPISSSNDDSSENETVYSPSVLEPVVPIRSRSEMSLYPKKDKKRLDRIGNLGATSIGTKFDPIFEKKLNDYQLKIDKENKLRDEIICELLAENERITEKLKKQHLLQDQPNLLFYQTNNYKKQNQNTKKKNNYHNNYENIFIIPELPTGRKLIIDILSTWGDKYYVGLNGIEIFDVEGRIVRVKKIRAVPPDVNILPECNNDPRVISNILDGVNRTQDDMHIWLAPFDRGCSHIITMEFFDFVTIAMIRIWNYNKSRIHSYRGVRDIVIFLDDQPIFKGEIAKACGGILGGIDAFGDTILFTVDEEILEKISKNDTSFSFLTSEPNSPQDIERPLTAANIVEIRPITGINQEQQKNQEIDQILFGANEIELVLLSNWGHPTMIGLTGLEIVQGTDSIINLNPNYLRSNVKSTNLNVLINDNNITTNPVEMWWVPFQFDEEIVIKIIFDSFKYISRLKLWNYNANLENSYAGVRALKILLDGKPVVNPLTKNEIFILRRAPGNCHYDFVQDLQFIDDIPTENELEDVSLLDKNEFYEPSTMPEGFVLQIIIFSTWGDQYYCGLNGIELFNQYGKKIVLEEQNICAYPESVNSLPNIQCDPRTPEKLIDNINNDQSGCHSWLAPIIPNHLNRIYIVMDRPIVISFVKLYNYSKTPNRGVKEFGILVDDLLVYNGILRKYSNDMETTFQTVLFTENETIIGNEYSTLIKNSTYTQDVVLLDEDGRGTTSGSLPEADPALRPFTSVNPSNRSFSN